MAQPSQAPQQGQMIGEAIGDMAMDAGVEDANNREMAMNNQFNDLMQNINNYKAPPAPNLISPPGFGPKPGRLDSRMQGQMQDMMGRLQQPRQNRPPAPMPQYNMPGPSQQYDFADRRPSTQIGNGFGQFQGNQMQSAPQQMPQGMQQPNSMSNFLNRNRFGR
jgi:hypothetical protein